MKRLFCLLIVCLLVLVGFSGCEGAGGGTNIPPTSTATATPAIAASPTTAPTATTATANGTQNPLIEQIITQYYTAIKAQNYPQAYTYLDANATNADGQKITLSSFEQMAQSMTSQEGPLVSFDIAVYPPMVIITASRTLLSAYHVHLQVQQEGQTWKIISLDRI